MVALQIRKLNSLTLGCTTVINIERTLINLEIAESHIFYNNRYAILPELGRLELSEAPDLVMLVNNMPRKINNKSKMKWQG